MIPRPCISLHGHKSLQKVAMASVIFNFNRKPAGNVIDSLDFCGGGLFVCLFVFFSFAPDNLLSRANVSAQCQPDVNV